MANHTFRDLRQPVGVGFARFAYTPLTLALTKAGWFTPSQAAYLGAANLAAPTVLPHVPPSRRRLASGVIFTGIGLGIAASGTLVPFALRLGLAETWLCLGALSLLLTGAAWGGWPTGGTREKVSERPAVTMAGEGRLPPHPALRLAFLVQAAAIGLLTVSSACGSLIVSSIVIGAFVPGIVTPALAIDLAVASLGKGDRVNPLD